MPIIRTTMRPDVEIEVGAAEYADLAAQGLVRAEAGQPGNTAGDDPGDDSGFPPLNQEPV
jgi:hypothetical protein